jgi:hypothetical protein
MKEILSLNIRKHRKIVFLILLCFLCCWGLNNCKSPEEPDNPFQYIYKAKVEITYSRDTSKINWSNGEDKATLMYELFDPDPNIRSDNDQKIIGQYRYGQLEMDKIGDNRFTGYLEQVFIQISGIQEQHVVYIQDQAISYGDDQTSQYTGENIIINDMCQTEIVPYAPGSSGTKLKFRLREEGGG